MAWEVNFVIYVFYNIQDEQRAIWGEMVELGSQHDMQNKESKVMAKISGLEKKIQFIVIEQVWDLF